MAETFKPIEDRLDKIENSLERLVEVVIDIARIKEQMNQVVINTSKTELQIEDLKKKHDTLYLENLTLKNQIEKNTNLRADIRKGFWIIFTSAIGFVFYLLQG